MTDADRSFYVLRNKTYEVVKVGIPSFDPEKEALAVFGNMFDWTLRVTRPEVEVYYAVNADDYSLIKSMELPAEEPRQRKLVNMYFHYVCRLLPVRINM